MFDIMFYILFQINPLHVLQLVILGSEALITLFDATPTLLAASLKL
jgi:hypothetical protein